MKLILGMLWFAAVVLLPVRVADASDMLSAGEHTATINGVALHYTVAGTGEPLVLLHPFGACAGIFAPFDASLGVYQRIAIDMRGHGQSTNPSKVFTHRQSAQDVLALMDKLGIQHFKAMGFSSGGMTLLHMATLQPKRVDAMVLVSATPRFTDEARAIQRKLSSPADLPPPVLAGYRRCAARGEPQVQELVKEFAHFADSHDDMAFTPATLGKISARTLIVHGDRDPFFPVALPVEMFGAIPVSALWIVPQGDHLPVFGAQMAPFLSEAVAFLDEKPASAAGGH
ncbi:MAG TPA: alpha/beta hydrolase [Dyella sp.]|uniref:alpha/beta fold hydrolase n=1 Tax=Dyella sp. TaxID=1869338 RepID=UPI002D767049|nr:alpha/beta hydrolase [Dyella sp.]HET6554084.1 alpha/beta hydrolase [Dyella sp.]